MSGPFTSLKEVLKIQSTIFIILKVETFVQFTIINFHAKANTLWNKKMKNCFEELDKMRAVVY